MNTFDAKHGEEVIMSMDVDVVFNDLMSDCVELTAPMVGDAPSFLETYSTGSYAVGDLFTPDYSVTHCGLTRQVSIRIFKIITFSCLFC